jgi:hypothetical protein
MTAVNIESRFRILIQRMIHNTAYTTAIGQDLGIEAPTSVFNPANGKPAFFIEMSSGGHPNLRWTKGKFQGVEIWKDAGTGFTKLDRDMRPDYIDKKTCQHINCIVSDFKFLDRFRHLQFIFPQMFDVIFEFFSFI